MCNYKTSDHIGNLTAALAAAQGEMKAALKAADNPYFKSKYADLAACIEASRAALSKHKLAVIQVPCDYTERQIGTTEDGREIFEKRIELTTILAHESGEFISSTLSLPLAKADAQGVGSAITYARRYAYCAIVGVATEDDDGNAASGNENGSVQKPAQKPNRIVRRKEPQEQQRQYVTFDRNGNAESILVPSKDGEKYVSLMDMSEEQLQWVLKQEIYAAAHQAASDCLNINACLDEAAIEQAEKAE